MLYKQAVNIKLLWPYKGILDVRARRKHGNLGWETADIYREINKLWEVKGGFFFFFCWKEMVIFFQRLNWEKVSPQQPSLLILYSENYIRPLERQEKGKGLPTEGWETWRR